jgi:hypothetical protein
MSHPTTNATSHEYRVSDDESKKRETFASISPESLKRMKNVLLGLGLAAVTCLLLWPLSAETARGVVSHLVTLIAAVYIGFAIGSKGELSVRRQLAGSAVFVALALAGLWHGWIWLVLGLALHGFWDFLHHGERGHDVVPGWYVPACAAYDWAVAAFVGYRYL